MMIRKGIRYTLGILLIASGALKLTSISYVAGILFSLLPLAWVNSFFAGHLAAVVILVSLAELLMGVLLLSRYMPQVLPIVSAYLALMVLVNGYQWYEGIGDCGCLGGWLQMMPS